ncbi:hypothetical protein V0288_11250 [Pannus brasiliensis CCIBt3594]|uniref:Uncharacterized protein n=1 Tax=Pannus brasiliensis CCIBt3594 TaxID=1427578 RepID=A0AAW9QS81_9CHRO
MSKYNDVFAKRSDGSEFLVLIDKSIRPVAKGELMVVLCPTSEVNFNCNDTLEIYGKTYLIVGIRPKEGKVTELDLRYE